LRFFARIFDACVVERQLRRRDGKLRVAVESLQTVRRKEFFWVPVANLAGAAHMKRARVEARDAANAALLSKNSVPKVFASSPDASNGPDPSDDRASSAHAVTLLAIVST
jgi:hypothetical protein